MMPERTDRLAQLFWGLAIALLIFSSIYALMVWRAPNSDRYDYAGRAYQFTQGNDLSTLIVYPLRMSFPGHENWPPTNLTRPPLWPILLIPGVRFGLGAQSGVLVSAILTALLLWFFGSALDSFGKLAGGFAALAFMSSFTTWRIVAEAGPEIAMGLIVLILWNFKPKGRGIWAHLACGCLYGLLPLLHPTGWLMAAAAFVARPGRYDRGGLQVLLGWALTAGPWYLHVWLTTGNPLGLIQSYAELARNLDAPGGLGPYRGLVPVPTQQVLAERGAEVLRLGVHHLKMHLLQFNAWLSWPLVALALLGALQRVRLALWDVCLGVAVFAILSPWSSEFRPLLPLLPVACLWVGRGMARLARGFSPAVVLCVGLLAIFGPWLVPPQASATLFTDARIWPLTVRHPDETIVRELQNAGEPGSPFFCDSSVLSFEARRTCVFLPESPRVLRQLQQKVPLRTARIIALGQGRASRWAQGPQWSAFLDSCRVVADEFQGALILETPTPGDSSLALEGRPAPADSSAVRIRVDQTHPLPADFVPPDLLEIPVPPASRQHLELRRDALAALLRMVDAAKQDGVELRVVSAYRSYARQKVLYERAQNRYGEAQRWVAAPGTSEHQLGTTVDFADASLKHAVDPSFAQTQEGRWLKAHAQDFGFDLSYPPETAESKGYHPEAWHYRYLERAKREKERKP
jgi:LAS superfamily LD-carboxypeptidase LdcB